METKENISSSTLEIIDINLQEKQQKLYKKMLYISIFLNPIFLGIILSIVFYIISIVSDITESFIYWIYLFIGIPSIYRLIWVPIHIVYFKKKWLLEQKKAKILLLVRWIPMILILLLFWGCTIIIFSMLGNIH